MSKLPLTLFILLLLQGHIIAVLKSASYSVAYIFSVCIQSLVTGIRCLKEYLNSPIPQVQKVFTSLLFTVSEAVLPSEKIASGYVASLYCFHQQYLPVYLKQSLMNRNLVFSGLVATNPTNAFSTVNHTCSYQENLILQPLYKLINEYTRKMNKVNEIGKSLTGFVTKAAFINSVVA